MYCFAIVKKWVTFFGGLPQKISLSFLVVIMLLAGKNVHAAPTGNFLDITSSYFGVIKGQVKDSATGEPLIGASIMVKGSNSGTTTDNKGHYQISAPEDAVLICSYSDYTSKEIPVDGRSVVDITLASNNVLGQVVVVGYGTQRKSDLSSSIASVNVKQLEKNAVLPNVAAALEGTTPGLSATLSSGAPGAKINIIVRGSKSFGNNSALVIIDGSPGDLNDVNPKDIASVQVLKDAAAAAIYGSRAANGVIIVTTKQGQSGKVKVDLGTSYGIQAPEKFMKVTNASQYAQLDNALHKTANIAPFAALSDPAALGNGTDWQNVFYSPAPILNTYMGISGGDAQATYRVSGSFTKQQGIAITSGYQKAMLHFGGQQHKGIFTFGENIGYTQLKQNSILDWLVQGLLVAQPIIPLYDSTNNGGFGGVPSYIPSQGYNAFGLTKLTQNTSNNHNLNADIYTQMHLGPITYKLNVGYKVWNGYDYNYTPTYYMSTNVNNNYAQLGEARSQTNHWVVENTLNYNKKTRLGSINALVGFTTEEDYSRSLGATVQGFPNNQVRVIGATTAYSLKASGEEQRWDLISEIVRFIYNYKERYYLTANVRRDGASKFGAENRYGVFPSLSGAWRISNESFFQSLNTSISNFKLRGSYGVLGNEPNSNYSYIPQIAYTTSQGYLYGSNFITGAGISGYTNPALQWETTKDFDLGIDLDFINHFSLTGDYYIEKTTNLLLNVPIPPSIGGGSPMVNTGELQNKGMELNLTYSSTPRKNGFHYNIAGNISTVKNKVLALGYGGEVIYGSSPTRAATGPVTAAQVNYPVGAFFLKQAAGLFQSAAEVSSWTGKNGTLLQPSAQPGDVRYVDVNNDGLIDNQDVVYSGSPFPDFSYGLNLSADYKNFDFTLFAQGTQGNKLFDANTWRLNQGTSDYNFSTDLLKAWTPTNTQTEVPRLSFNDPNHNADPSTRFLYDASFLRLKTIQLGYTLPDPVLRRLRISGLRIYASANNLLTITKYPGYDPSYTANGMLDRGLDQSLYPIARIVSAGLDLHF